MRLITDNTAVSIGLMGTACATIFGVGVFYGSVKAQGQEIAALHSTDDAYARELEDIKEKYNKDVISIKEAIARMEGIMLGTAKK